VDLDIDIGADAVDYKWVVLVCQVLADRSSAIANQESLSILEVEMRKLEAVTKEIVDEMGYLQRREQRMRDTNGGFGLLQELRFVSLKANHSLNSPGSLTPRFKRAWLPAPWR